MPDSKKARNGGMNAAEDVLATVPPYNFLLSIRLFSHQAPYPNNKFQAAVRAEETPLLVSVTDLGSVDQPEIRMQVQALCPLTKQHLVEAKVLTTHMLNLPLDLTAFYRCIREDRVLGEVVHTLRGLKPRTTPTVFEALVRAIIEQQISLATAHRIQERVIQKYGQRFVIDERTWFLFPTPEDLAQSKEEELRT